MHTGNNYLHSGWHRDWHDGSHVVWSKEALVGTRPTFSSLPQSHDMAQRPGGGAGSAAAGDDTPDLDDDETSDLGGVAAPFVLPGTWQHCEEVAGEPHQAVLHSD